MTNTTTAYLSIADNLARFQTQTNNEPAVKTAAAYYAKNIGAVKSASQLIGDYRLLSYALKAYGLGDQVNNKALIQKVLAGGVANSHALANTLPNPAWRKFAAAFNFAAKGATAPTSSKSVATTKSDYVEQQLESDQGQSDPGIQLALYFARVAPTITNSFQILGDENLLEVVQTIFNLPATASASQIDKEAKAVSKLAPIADLSNPKKLSQLVERFTANYDLTYGPTSGATASLTVASGNQTSSVSAASTILAGITSSNATALGSLGYAAGISSSLLMGLSLGG